MTTASGTGRKVSVAEFELIFESVKNWGRWGPDDQLGTLNLITPERVRAAAGLVRYGPPSLDGDPDQHGRWA